LPLSSAKEIENLLLRTERRLKEIYEHRPTSLILAVNGEVLASRDIGASFNGLKVEAPTRGLKFIEVLTEHGASLLSWAVESTPPHSDPVVHRVAKFSMGRRLGVDLQFSAHKVIIEAQYQDPFYGEILSPSFAAMARNSDEEDEAEVVLVKPRDSWAAVLHRKLLTQWRRFTFTPLIATGLVCAVVLVAGLFLDLRGFNRVKPGEFMQRAMVSERRDAQSAKSGVILQQVAIRSSQGSFERSIYRDPEGKRHVKRQPLDERKERLKERLAEAGIDWDTPLSAASFAEWQAHSHIKDESVHSVNDKFLTLSVDTEGSDVEQETITIRTADFHPVGRTAEFRDVGTIEIAEVNYAVIPWATVNQGLFENDAFSSGPLAAAPRQLPLLPRPSSLSEVDLDWLELKVRTALHELHADSTDRLTVSRNTSGVQVSGMVEDDKQKLDLKRRLSQFPHVSANLTTVNDATLRPQETKPPGSVQLVSVVAGPSLLETFLLEQGKSREVSNDLADRLFAASSALLRANKAELKLQERFRSDTLSPAALDLYERLLDSWFGELNTALSDESEAIRQTGIQIEPAKPGRSEQAAISAEVEKNRVLLKELIGHDAPATRTAPVVLADLARSVESLRTASNEEHEKVPQRRSPSIPSARNIQP
jgi:hypothetical protein